MADQEVIDHEARRLAQTAITEVDHAKDTLRTLMRRTELFEAEVRSGLQNIVQANQSQSEKLHADIVRTAGDLHERLNTLIRGVLLGTFGLLGTGVIGLVAFLIDGMGK